MYCKCTKYRRTNNSGAYETRGECIWLIATAAPGAACAANEFQCLSSDQCVPLSYHCDGEDDCQDQSDERGCCKSAHCYICRMFYVAFFVCCKLARRKCAFSGNRLKIARTSWLLGGCICRWRHLLHVLLALPRITVSPPGERRAEPGDTVVISCEAVGIPTPLIVWRLNWGQVADPPRVTYSTEKLEGTPDWASGGKTGRGQITIRQARAQDEGAYTCEAINSKGNVFAVPDTILHVLREYRL